MKKLIFMFFAIFGMTLTGCSWFKPPSVEPQIIGVGILECDENHDLCYVTIDSMPYTVAQFYTLNTTNKPQVFFKPQKIMDYEGTEVTVFTVKDEIGVQAICGVKSVSQLEDLLQTRISFALFVCFFIFIILIMCLIMSGRLKFDKPNKKFIK